MSGWLEAASPQLKIKKPKKQIHRALAEQFAAEVGVDPRPNETLVEIDERGAFIRQQMHLSSHSAIKEGDLKAEANRFGIYWATGCNWLQPLRSSCGSF